MILLANKVNFLFGDFIEKKCDLPDIQIDEEKMTKFAKENGFFAWYETSAKTNQNVDRAFRDLVAHIMNITKHIKVEVPKQNDSNTLNIVDQPKPRKRLPPKSDDGYDPRSSLPRRETGCCTDG